MRSRTALILVIATSLFLGLTGTSFADVSSSLAGNADAGQYSEPTINAPTLVGGSQALQAQPNASSGAQLPFTGFAAITVLIVGVALTAGGVAIRRFSRPTGRAS